MQPYILISVNLFVCLFMSITQAGSISFRDRNKDAVFSVSYKESVHAATKPLDVSDGIHKLDFSDLSFGNNSIREIIFILNWIPKESDVPAKFVSDMDIEIPVIVRKWSKDDLFIETDYFKGSGVRRVEEYEKLGEQSRYFEKYIASCLLVKHYTRNNLGFDFPRPRRMLHTCIETGHQISSSDGGSWFQISPTFGDLVPKAFSNEENVSRLWSLYLGTRGRVFQNLIGIELNSDFRSMTCEQRKQFFNFLRFRPVDFVGSESAYFSQNPMEFIQQKEELALADCQI